jgi:hypothetical protein
VNLRVRTSSQARTLARTSGLVSTSGNEEKAGEPFRTGCPLSVGPAPGSGLPRLADNDIRSASRRQALAGQPSELQRRPVVQSTRRSGSCCAVPGMYPTGSPPSRPESAVAATPGSEVGRAKGVPKACFRGVAKPMLGCAGEHAAVAWCTGLPLVRPSSRPVRVPLAGVGAVQHGSTATHADRGGRVGTREDGDLRGWTWVDVLPPDGMQEVSGSSPLSSTGQRHNSKYWPQGSGASTAVKYRNGDRLRYRTPVRIRVFLWATAAGMARGDRTSWQLRAF